MAGPWRVFIVEDSNAITSSLTELLDELGDFEVVASHVGESPATEWLHKHPVEWDLAILDLLLQEGSGFGLVHRFRQEHPAGKVVVFSEFATPALKAKCVDIGADAVFKKSELKDFVAYLEALAAQPRPD